jgi:hypothetical protein
VRKTKSKDTRPLLDVIKEGRELGIKDLREMFHVDEAAWLLYRWPNGRVAGQPDTKRGKRNLELALKEGAVNIGRATGVSLKCALAAAKKSASKR